MIQAILIDDSLLVRNVFFKLIEKGSEIKIIATGKTGLDCIELAEKLKPDIIILDIEMPVMDGISALEEMRKKKLNIPVIILSSNSEKGAQITLKALELGVVDFVPKPGPADQLTPEEITLILKLKIKEYFEGQDSKKKIIAPSPKIDRQKLPHSQIAAIGVGTSTGGPKALHIFFSQIPSGFPLPIFVVQHMPPGFTKAFAERMNEISKISVKEAVNDEIVQPGFAYIAPGDFHMTVSQVGNNVKIILDKNPNVNGHRPSVEKTFTSIYSVYGSGLIAAICTGMGKDGSEYMKVIRNGGGVTIAQDAESSVVFGMNRQAIEFGGIDYILPIDKIMQKISEIKEERGK